MPCSRVVPVLLGNFPQDAENQPPGEFRRPLARARSAAHGDAQLGGCVNVERGVPRPRGDEAAQRRQPFQQAARKRRALPHPHHDVKVRQPFGQRILVRQVLLEIRNVDSGRQTVPVRQVGGHALVIVKNGNFHVVVHLKQ